MSQRRASRADTEERLAFLAFDEEDQRQLMDACARIEAETPETEKKYRALADSLADRYLSNT